MKVKEYLVNRIMELEKDLKKARNEYAGAKVKAQMLNEDIKDLSEQLDHYEMEKEHIKEIITCNIGRDAYNHLSININIGNNDFKTLLAILDIKPEDYSESQKEPVYEFDDTKPNCAACIHRDLEPLADICFVCGPQYRNFERRIEDAENTD